MSISIIRRNSDESSIVDTAVVWTDEIAYFFRKDRYARYSVSKDRVENFYPLSIHRAWNQYGVGGLWSSDIDAATL